MNKFKKLFIALMITGFLSAISTYATENSYVNYLVRLKVYSVYDTLGTEYKLDSSLGQKYYNSTNVNDCTTNENKIKVHINCIGQSQELSAEVLSKGGTANWNNNASKICSRYNVEVKNNVFSPCNSTHSGTWTHN